MTMSKRHWIAIVTGLVLVAGMVAGATQSAAIPLFNSRGTIEPFTIHDHSMHFKMKSKRAIDVAVVGARLDPGGETGWHMHPAESIVTVQPGSPNLRMVFVENGECVTETFSAGQGFVHPAGPHNFVNTSSSAPLTFGVAYFVPVGSTLLTNVPAPPECA
jgi:quercetin dioxygenase-like cupin family protein